MDYEAQYEAHKVKAKELWPLHSLSYDLYVRDLECAHDLRHPLPDPEARKRSLDAADKFDKEFRARVPLCEKLKAVYKEWDKFLKEARGTHPFLKDFEEEIVKKAHDLDELLARDYNYKPEERRRVSFMTRAYRYIKRVKSATSPVAKMVGKIKRGGGATDNMIAEMLLGKSDKFKVSGDLWTRANEKRIVTAATWDILDYLTTEISSCWIDDLEKNGILPPKLELGEDTLRWILTTDHDVQTAIPLFYSPLKRFLGKTGWDRAQIEKQVESLSRLHYEGTLSFPIKDGRLAEIRIPPLPFAAVYFPKNKAAWDLIRSIPDFSAWSRDLEEEGGCIVSFTGLPWGMLFFLNALNRNIRILPKRFYMELSPSARLLFRLTIHHPNEGVTLSQIVKVNGWQEKIGDEGMRLRLQKIQEDWTELFKKGFIKSVPKPVEEEGELVWHYVHEKGWDEAPPVIDTICRVLP